MRTYSMPIGWHCFVSVGDKTVPPPGTIRAPSMASLVTADTDSGWRTSSGRIYLCCYSDLTSGAAAVAAAVMAAAVAVAAAAAAAAVMVASGHCKGECGRGRGASHSNRVSGSNY